MSAAAGPAHMPLLPRHVPGPDDAEEEPSARSPGRSILSIARVTQLICKANLWRDRALCNKELRRWNEEHGGEVIPADSEPFECEAGALRWVPTTMVPDELREPAREWAAQWKEETDQHACHLALGANVAGPAARRALLANVLLWTSFIVNTAVAWHTSECDGPYARAPLYTALVFLPFLVASLCLEQGALKYVLAVPHTLGIGRHTLFGVHWSFRSWRLITLGFSLLVHMDIYTNALFVVFATKSIHVCDEQGVIERTWREVMSQSTIFQVCPIRLFSLAVLSWCGIFVQAFVALGAAMPIEKVDWAVQPETELSVRYRTLFCGATKMSHYDALQYLADGARMYSITVNDFVYETAMVIREIDRLQHMMRERSSADSRQVSRSGTGTESVASQKSVAVASVSSIRESREASFAWAIMRSTTVLRKKLSYFLLYFIVENMLQLNLKITFGAIQSNDTMGSQLRGWDFMAIFSTATTLAVSLLTLRTFVRIAVTSQKWMAVMHRGIRRYGIDAHKSVYVKYFLRRVKIADMLWTQTFLVNCLFASVCLGACALVYTALKLVMGSTFCESGLWNLSSPWHLKAGCVSLERYD